MAADSSISAESPQHLRLVPAILLVAVGFNLLYPGEVFFQSRYLLVLASLMTCALVFYRNHQKPISAVMRRHLALAFLPLAALTPSLIWTTNQDRSQEVLLLFFSYSCLLFSLWRCQIRSDARLTALSILIVVTLVIEGQALYQHFVGLNTLKAELMQRAAMNAEFKEALLARVQSGRIFANFSLPNTLAGLVTMILPIQAGLLCASFFPLRLQEPSPCWITILTSRPARVLLIAGILLSMWVLALTQSFGGWVGLCCSLGAMLFVWRCKTGRRAPWILSLSLLVLLAGAWLSWTSYKRGFHLWNLRAAENPISLRLISYRTALTMFQEFPITGVGLGNFGAMNPRYQSSPRFVTQFTHNTPLQLLSEGGLVLLAGSFFVGAVALRPKSARTPIQSRVVSGDPLYLGILGSLVAWLVHNALDIDLYFPSLGALGFFVLGLFSSYQGNEVEDRETNSSRVAKVSVVVIQVALAVALITGLRFQLSRSFLDLAGISASSGNPADARRFARWAVKLKPLDASSIVLLAKLETQQLKQSGQPVSVLLQRLNQSLQRAVRLDPYNAEFHFELSRTYKGLGEEKLSAESRARAVALFPSEPAYRTMNAR